MVYLLVYSNSFGDREELSKFFSACSYIDHWRYDLPNSFYLVSDESAFELGKRFKQQFPNARYLLVEITNNRQGWLPKDTWNFIHNYEEEY